MEIDSSMHALGLTLQMFLLDLVLSGDNAIVIALACRNLPVRQMRQAILIGTVTAILLRVVFTTMVTFLLAIPTLKLLGMVALLTIAIKLMLDGDEPYDAAATPSAHDWKHIAVNLRSAVGIIVVADVTMSLDNVVALAAIARDNWFLLILGLSLSIPVLMIGSQLVARLLKGNTILIAAGGALLGWIAGDIGMSDPLIADWVMTQSPGLTLAVPLACAIFVLVESKIIETNQPHFPKVALQPRRATREAAPSTQAAEPSPLSASEVLPTPAPAHSSPINNASAEAIPSIWSRKAVVSTVIGLLALPALGAIGTIVYRGVINHGLMPPPTPLFSYDCPGSQGVFRFYFRHGIEKLRIHGQAGELKGNVHNGKITWDNFSGDTALLGFTPPQEITWDDGTSVTISGGSFLQVRCTKTPEGMGSP